MAPPMLIEIVPDSDIGMVDRILIFSICLLVLIENGDFGASPLRTSVWCIPGRASFFLADITFLKKHDI